MDELLRVENLKTYFATEKGYVRAVDDVSLRIGKQQTVGLVGESGCGKSVTAMSILRLVAKPHGRIMGGKILFNGKDLLQCKEEEMRQIRGDRISMVFQEPMTSLNPVFTIGDQLMEAIMLHQSTNKKVARERALDMLSLVGIPNPNQVIDFYPHKLSGGMRQRAMIAMALSCEPELLIADEPTTALDVTIQAQILDLMRDLQSKVRTSILLITHDLGVVAEMCEYVVVMYGGKVVEEADATTIYGAPCHPYTIGLLESRPSLAKDKEKLASIPGHVPSPANLPDGCYFHPRCEKCMDICRKESPELREIAPGHSVRCWLFDKGGAQA